MPDTPAPLLTPSHRLRRQFIKGTIGTIVGAVAAYFGWTKLLFPPPAAVPAARKGGTPLGKASQFEENAAPAFVNLPSMEATYIVENNGGTVRVLNAKCTHQGCIVGWDAKNNQFLCPCHAARYDRSGKVVSGPAPLPLAPVNSDVRDGELFISS